jgi:hypothetical protein
MSRAISNHLSRIDQLRSFQSRQSGKLEEAKKEKDHEAINVAQRCFDMYREEEIDVSFQAKKLDPTFELSKEAKKVYAIAKQITDLQDDDILRFGGDLAFLVHHNHIYKRIQVLGETYRATLVEGELTLSNRKVSELREDSHAHPDLVFNLDGYSVKSATAGAPINEVQKNFRREGDGNYYLSVVTCCPKERLVMKGSHTWMRLINHKGEVISFGKFPKPVNPTLFAKEPVEFKNADTKEWQAEKKTIEEKLFPLSKREFKVLKEEIKQDLIHSDQHDFNFFCQNCSDYVLDKLAKFYDIDKSKARVDGFDILLNSWGWSLYKKWIPHTLQKVIDPVRRIASLILLQPLRFALMSALGGFKVNKENPHSKSFISEQSWFGRVTDITAPYAVRAYLNAHYDEILANKKF